ncbi:MAG: cardiolipin synthase [Casimicrobium sp.]
MFTFRLRSRSIFVGVIAVVALTLLISNFWQTKPRISELPNKQYGVRDVQFMRDMGVLIGPSLVNGNAARVLLNGEQIFPTMLSAIAKAQKTICFETYIYWSGDIGRDFAEALSERARAGVRVHVLLDWVGSAKMDESLLEQMRHAGVEIKKFHKPTWHTLSRMNNRTHRKLLVVDGEIGYTGGVGIAQNWTGHAQDENHWRDSHFEVRGPVVGQVQATFMENWLKVTGKPLAGEAYFPALAPVGSSPAQVFSSSPDGGADSMELMYHMMIVAADRSIDLSMAYFVPDPMSSSALIAALQRGVRVRIIVPGEVTDSQIVGAASRRLWGPLLKAGAEIYQYQPTMYHCKVMIVDDFLVSVGSTNFDSRSFRLNDEANLNIYDEQFAAQQRIVFENDLERSRRVTLTEWADRSVWERLKELPGVILGSQL